MEGPTAQFIASGLDRPKKIGNKWRCDCPLCGVHALIIEDKNSTTLWHCHVCGKEGQAELTRALREKGLVPGKTNGAGEPAIGIVLQPQIVETYLYGETLRKHRWEPGRDGKSKSFTWEHLTENGWDKGKGDNRDRLYRKENIEAAGENDLVFVVESERSAKLLGSMGLSAVSTGGSGGWSSGYADDLRGHRVVLLPDADKAGEAWSARIKGDVPGAVSIALPGLPSGQGPDHWPDLSVDTLLRICRDHLERDWSWAQVENRAVADIPVPEMFLDPLIHTGSRVYVTGATGVGKTLFAMALCRVMAEGSSLGIYEKGDTAARVLFVDYEMGRAAMKDRCAGMRGFWAVCYDDPQLGEDGLMPLDSPEGQRQAHELITAMRAHVVIFDNLYSAVQGSIAGGSDKGGAHEKITPFLRGLSKQGVSSILFHHSGHDKTREYGDSRLSWPMDAHLHLEAPAERVEGELRVCVTEKKIRAKRPPAVPFTMFWEAGKWWLVEEEKTPKEKPLSDRQSWLCAEIERTLDEKSFRTAERDYPVIHESDVREAYKKRWFAHDPNGAAARVAWGRDLPSLVTYFTAEGFYLYRTRKMAT